MIARGFFLPSQRANLPQVPACSSCNNAKSQLKHHLLTVLPFGARHSTASRTLNELVPGRLERNARLHCGTARRMEPAVAGSVRPALEPGNEAPARWQQGRAPV